MYKCYNVLTVVTIIHEIVQCTIMSVTKTLSKELSNIVFILH